MLCHLTVLVCCFIPDLYCSLNVLLCDYCFVLILVHDSLLICQNKRCIVILFENLKFLRSTVQAPSLPGEIELGV